MLLIGNNMPEQKNILRESFETFKTRKSIKKLLKEIDEEFDPE